METFVVRDLEVPLNTGLAEQLKPEHFAEDGVELHQCSQGAYYQEENSMSLWLKFSSNEAEIGQRPYSIKHQKLC